MDPFEDQPMLTMLEIRSWVSRALGMQLENVSVELADYGKIVVRVDRIVRDIRSVQWIFDRVLERLPDGTALDLIVKADV